MREFMESWNKSNGERVKLQYAYAVIALVLLVAAGLAGLINDSLGQSILNVAFALTVIFFVNAVSWVLLESFVLRKLNKTVRKK